VKHIKDVWILLQGLDLVALSSLTHVICDICGKSGAKGDTCVDGIASVTIEGIASVVSVVGLLIL
jgi:hypothetical protein